ncbi:MAG: hypothetical protein ABIS50_11470 [Luteolibacter sp.]|uniref:hypothetical protein n=1 Tax=Luteolibacter sp. TaxID=1962973 RepID=UPI0032657E8B
MKPSLLRLLFMVCLIGLLPSCVTTVDPKGVKTTTPDAPTIGLVSGMVKWAVDSWAVAHAPTPVIVPVISQDK